VLIVVFYREITDKCIHLDTFQNMPALIQVIKKHIESNNQNPQVFVWTASVVQILSKITKCKETLDALKYTTSPLSMPVWFDSNFAKTPFPDLIVPLGCIRQKQDILLDIW